MPKYNAKHKQPTSTNQKDGGLLPLDTHLKRAGKQHRKRVAQTKRGHAGGAPSGWSG